MNALKNHVQLIGNLGQDPEIKELESGKKLAKFSIATTESYKNKNGEIVNDTQWHSIVAWDSLAGIAEKYLHKGKQVALAGKLTHRNYEDKDGIKRYVTEIVANDLLMLGKRETATAGDELPF
ncbi:single-stranded DNA-binding protein [Tunicatimonas pelagia]|uniref:single-stranded DNA-binding protein n=1 Tax=Tunicatimonas pelagia TaxID=931531 RepID=UPI0026658E5E|nr:single-stranded DNA-binding protein [Tunicatimonas pelagia]WKN46187.1 single-stranded DNA-binding protein [Tunicatimonas pelagia]